jgi:hypothetical protein
LTTETQRHREGNGKITIFNPNNIIMSEIEDPESEDCARRL